MSSKYEWVAIGIAVVSLLVSISATSFNYLGNKSQEANFIRAVQPHISLVPQADPSNNGVGFYFYNDGPGVGYIENLIVINKNGQKFDLSDTSEKSPATALADIIGFNQTCLRMGFPKKGNSLAVDKMEPLIAISTPPIIRTECNEYLSEMVQYTKNKTYNFQVEMVYRSSYGKKYSYSFPSNVTKELD
ncbi:hypothetical protein [Proteus sp. NMG38-2]|uniref:hypothetical protein n=1 Tax=Proteus sp. NMG38-2 TaxID=2883107 RepID=UPI001D0B43A7|nr:hypothetical protein [Proteus sp. NMG38-2]UDN34860.1 hypothetical protein LG402_14040 [Proteus sp. NMG38-2]